MNTYEDLNHEALKAHADDHGLFVFVEPVRFDGDRFDHERAAQELADIVVEATGRHCSIATSHADANLMQVGNHRTDVTDCLADTLQAMTEDAAYWSPM